MLAVTIGVAPALSAGRGQGPTVGGAPPAGTVDEGPSVRVNSPIELRDLLLREPPYRGRILIPANARWTMTTELLDVPVRSGVKIIGERGYLGSRPRLRWTSKLAGSIFVVTGTDVRIEGLHMVGPKPTRDHAKREDFFNAIHVKKNAADPPRVVIADNEIEQWSGGAVLIGGDYYETTPDKWDPARPYLGRRHIGLVRVERNYLHDNAMDGAGYGVKVTGGGWATIEGNVFDTNRHAVEGLGYAYSGYAARFNYVLQGGVKQDSYWNQHFDMHGTASGGYGGYAGEHVEISYNTIRGEQGYRCFGGCLKARPAFMLRGRPAQDALFFGNVAVHDDLDEAVSLKMERNDTGIGESHSRHNFRAGGNRFDVDYSTEIAAGDFDADGRSDVFVANGTAWFFSRAGIRPWEYLRASNKRTGELAFADIDNDRATDVLYRAPDGALGYIKGGRGDLLPLTSLPVPIKDVRSGDFDGDGLTDLFYTRNDQWNVWYGRTRAWTETNTSSKRISQLLFGQFDIGATTDVAAVLNNGWSISRSSTQPWARINGRLTSSFDDAVAADFDGDGRTDIAVGDGQKWRLSRNGSSPLTVMRDGSPLAPYPALKRLLVGRFDGGARSKVIAWRLERRGARIVFGERLATWSGPGTGNALATRSDQDMR
ncbi:MAG TPA: VCBS repeat-containing protein [Solirubrobacteraceae bacterium]|nr:VCBS repeat-containing protein [Solirubrobacteraceae bacterium]